MIQIELSEEEYQTLLFLLGIAGGTASREGLRELTQKSMHLAQSIIRQRDLTREPAS